MKILVTDKDRGEVISELDATITETPDMIELTNKKSPDMIEIGNKDNIFDTDEEG